MVEKTLAQKMDDQLRNTNISVQNAIKWFKDNALLLRDFAKFTYAHPSGMAMEPGGPPPGGPGGPGGGGPGGPSGPGGGGGGRRKPINANILMARQRLVPSYSLRGTKYIGRMIMFFYQPKLRETLPFYDMFPMVIVICPYPDGFLGLNLHYLPIKQRRDLLLGLYAIYKSRHLDEKKKLSLTYGMLKGSSRLRYYKPCLKRYLFVGNDYRGGGVTSYFGVVDPEEWDKMITLPVERFMKQSASYVQAHSLRSVGR